MASPAVIGPVCLPMIAIGCSTPSAKSCNMRVSPPKAKPAAASCARVTTYQPSALMEIFAAANPSRYALDTSDVTGLCGPRGGTGRGSGKRAPGRHGVASEPGVDDANDRVSRLNSVACAAGAASETVESAFTGPCVLRPPSRSTSSNTYDDPGAPSGSTH